MNRKALIGYQTGIDFLHTVLHGNCEAVWENPLDVAVAEFWGGKGPKLGFDICIKMTRNLLFKALLRLD